MTTQIFLSFASADLALCDATYTYLTERSFNCWRFLERNQVGDEWLTKIHSSLSSSAAVVPLITPGYLTSRICCEELDLALRLKVPVFPLLCAGLEVDSIPEKWRNLVFQELRAEYDVPSLEKLYHALRDRGIAPYAPKANIRVYRPAKFEGKGNDFSVICDGDRLGILQSGETYEWEISTGQHVLRVEYSIYHPGTTRHPGYYAEGKSSDLPFLFVAGKSYFFETGYVRGLESFFSGWFGPSKLYFRQR